MPPIERLAISDVFDTSGKPKADVLKSHFLKEGRVEEEVALKIIQDTTELLQREPTMLDVEAPITGRQISRLYLVVLTQRSGAGRTRR